MGFAACDWPIWHYDDLSYCFQHDYLRVLFPLVVISLSFLNLVVQSGRAAAARIKQRRAAYHPIPEHEPRQGAARHTDLPLEEDGAVDSEAEDEEGLTINGGRLALVKTTTKGSIVQADHPPAQTLSVVAEELAVVGLVAINVVALVKGTYGSGGRVGVIVGLATWTYVLVLASVRLLMGNGARRVPRLWNHTAVIYGCQWLFLVAIFRSTLVHPLSRLSQIMIIVEFALTTLLFVMAITTRKGNKTIMLEWEDGIPPSRENLASVFSDFTFGWVDSIVWDGYKAPYEIDKVWNLLPKDKATAVLAHYRQVKKTVALSLHLLSYFKSMLIAQAIWAVIGGVFTFVPTMLLRAILEYVENPRSPRNVLWLYVILLPVTDMVASLANNRALWIGRKICINVRAILIGEIYAKSLRRKASAGKDSSLGAGKQGEKPLGRLARLKRMIGLSGGDGNKKGDAAKGDEDKDKDKKDKKDPAATDEQANLGTIINLMSVDSFKVSEVTAYLHFIVAAAPSQLIVSVFLLYQVMGLSAIPGFIVMAALIPINIAFGRAFNSTQKTIMAATDKRIHTTNEILQNIRIIKYFAWEHRFGNIVNEKRAAELRALRKRYVVWAMAVAVWNTVPVLITFFSFLVYTFIEKKSLHPSVAFTAISLFMLLRVPLDQFGDMLAHVQEAKVSVDRIEEFLSEDETDKFTQLGEDNIDESGERVIGFRKATFIWGGKDVIAEDGSMAFRLLDLDLEFKIGGLNVVTGPTGSGKTSLLMALLGEMTLLEGRVYLPGGRSREDVRPDPETGLAETCAYVAQQAWLVNANIRDNILFSAPFDEKRYHDVIVACALERDLEILDNGDETLVGEKGITLSGGQKQRISLARAVYSNSMHLLLDDCLSAVDSHTAQWIFSNCIKGPLMRGRTCILVSHNIPLCVPHSDYTVIMNNGRISNQGPSAEIIAAGLLGEDVQNKSAGTSPSVSHVPSRVPSSVGEESGDTLIDANGGDHLSKPRRDSQALQGGSPKKDGKKDKKDKKQAVQPEEGIVTGAVKWDVIQLYLRSMGSTWFWFVTCLVFGLQQISGVASNYWIKEWANQYPTTESNHYMTNAADAGNMTMSSSSSILFSLNSHSYSIQSFSPTYLASISTYIRDNTPFGAGNGTTALEALMAPEVNVSYYLLVLAAIGMAGALMAFVRDMWIFFGSVAASYKIHDRLMSTVSRAKFGFFDVTPLGQIMNRFSKDLEAVDQEVAPVAIGVMSCALGIVVTVVLIAAITPGFLVAGVFITAAYVYLGKFYLSSSRDLKRLESVARSPLFQQFGETLSGVTTIRAYGEERRFVRDNMARINTQLRPFIYLWAANRWLAFRTDLLGDFVAFFAGMFVILSLGKIDAGSAGLSMSYAIGFSENILWLVRLYAMNEQNMNSVERIKEYLEVEQEAEPIVEKNRPPQDWPSKGAVEFVGYTTRYRKDLEPVLRNVTFRIAAREKVGIVGRTGAGKSSLALAIFRALEADEGKILIDDIDIGQIGLRDLREAITIVPQEPTLFMGTIRSNLDPFELFTDEQLFAALRRVQLISAEEESSRSTPGTGAPPSIVEVPQDTEGEGGNVAAATTPPSPSTSTTAPAAAPAASTAPPAAPAATNKNIFLNLSSPVSESGSNLSQGQRQLLCLARAMLKEPSVLVMDEATASIDYATDAKIQDTIRELTTTIITIAHRLQTIVDYDKVLVLDKGQVVEFGHPWELMQQQKSNNGSSSPSSPSATTTASGGASTRSGATASTAVASSSPGTAGPGATTTTGIFRSMCDMSGDYDVLAKAAKKAWDAKNNVNTLVDIDGDDDGDGDGDGDDSATATATTTTTAAP